MAFNWNKFPWTNLHDLNLDWIIQTVKQLENRVAELAVTVQLYTAEFTERVQEVITNTLTGSGDLTIQKTGDVRITANSVQVTGGSTFIDHGDQVTLYDPDSKTGMSATYASSKLDLWNNQDLNRGVAVYHVRTPEEGEYSEATYPHNNFAASVGYVKTSVNAVSEALATETENRTAGDNALQSTVDNVIMPLLNNLGKRAPRVIYASVADTTQCTHTLTAEQIAPIKTALLEHTPIMLCVDSTGDAQQFFYQLDNCDSIPASGNIDGALTLTFKTVSSGSTATLALNSGVITFT